MGQQQGRNAGEVWAAQLIRGARARHGFTHQWAAELLGVTAGFLLMVETGQTPPTVSFCRRVIGTFNMPEQEAAELLAAVGVVEEEVRTWSSV